MLGRRIFFLLAWAVGLWIFPSGRGACQIHINSPYSKFGMGRLFDQGSTYQLSMGGISTALFSNRYLNALNPAGNHGIDTLSFVFNGGIHSQLGRLASDESAANSSFASLGYLMFGFPVNRWLKTGIGLIPYSNVGYKIIESRSLPMIGKTEYYYQGSGGVNEFYTGFSVSPFRRVSLGIKASYLFGKSTRSASIFFPDSAGMLSTKLDHDLELGDVYFCYGIQYHWKLSSDHLLGLGLLYSPAQNIRSKRDYLVRSFFYSVYGVESFRDTILIKKGKGTVVLPEKFSAGFIWQNGQKWMVGGDVTWQQWSGYRAFDQVDSLQNSMKISVGGEFLPATTTLDSYWKNIRYRLGVNYHVTPLNLQGQSIDDFGISFGVGLPLPRSMTILNVGLMAGNLGTTQRGLIRERYVKFNVGVSVLERWFVKSKYF